MEAQARDLVGPVHSSKRSGWCTSRMAADLTNIRAANHKRKRWCKVGSPGWCHRCRWLLACRVLRWHMACHSSSWVRCPSRRLCMHRRRRIHKASTVRRWPTWLRRRNSNSCQCHHRAQLVHLVLHLPHRTFIKNRSLHRISLVSHITWRTIRLSHLLDCHMALLLTLALNHRSRPQPPHLQDSVHRLPKLHLARALLPRQLESASCSHGVC